MSKRKNFSFSKLIIWQKSHDLVLQVYLETRKFPKSELYGITSQIRRSASSVPANIVEGYSRKTKKEFIQFLYQSKGSLSELTYFIFLSKDLNYLSSNKADSLIDKALELSKMLSAFIKNQKQKL